MRLYLPLLDIMSNTREKARIKDRVNRYNVTLEKAMKNNQRRKILEEAGEIFRSINNQNEIEECLDVLQATFQLLDMLITQNENEVHLGASKHYAKLDKRKWKVKGDINIDIEYNKKYVL